jgi:hypothetical protein
MPIYNPGKGFTKGNRGFGVQKHPITKKISSHGGQDFPAAQGTSIPAAYDGTVEKVAFQYNKKSGTGWGWYVLLKHKISGKKVQTRYAHMPKKSHLLEGGTIKKGESVGLVGRSGGSTGPHLHFEVIVEGVKVNPDNFDFPDDGALNSDSVGLWAFPFKNFKGKEITDASAYIGAPAPIASEASFPRADNGFFPIGANGLWHGGVHFDAGTGTLLDQHEGVRCIRDGEVVAYFVDKQYPEIEFTTSKKKAAYSMSFTLVRHILELPALPKEKQATNEQNPWGTIDWKLPFPNVIQPLPTAPMLGPLGMQTIKEPPKEKKEILTFFSLYMHQQDWLEYDNKQALPRPAYWVESKTMFRVGENAKDKQALLPLPVDMIDASERQEIHWAANDLNVIDHGDQIYDDFCVSCIDDDELFV